MSLSYGVKAACCQHGLSTVDGHRDPRLAIIAFQLSPECTSAPALHPVLWMEVIVQPSLKGLVLFPTSRRVCISVCISSWEVCHLSPACPVPGHLSQ